MSRLVLLSCIALAFVAFVVAQDPGALVRVTATGEIGVLLTEYPTEVRNRVKDWAGTRPDSYWKDAVVRQTQMAQYRLIFRPAWYSAGAGKLSLPFPTDQLSITFTSDATATLHNGLEVVKRSYSLETYIVSDIASVNAADKKLQTVNGAALTEPFTLPLDPYLVYQRVGYACMDEGQFPLESLDGENADVYFDDTCVKEKPYDGNGGCNQCHCTYTADVSCVTQLGLTSGAVAVTFVFQRLPYDAARVAAIESRVNYPISTTAGGDIQAVVSDMNHNYVAYRYVLPGSCTLLECIQQPGWRRLLYWDAVHINTGTKNVEIGAISYLKNDPTSFDPLTQHNLYYWDPCHQHPHFSAFANYNLGSTLGHKQGFCIQSTNRYVNARWSPLSQSYWDCGHQGIAPGWVDSYNAGIPCQWIDVTDINTRTQPKTLPLTMDTNPKGWLCEGTVNVDANGDPLWVPTNETTSGGQSIDKYSCNVAPGALANNVDTVSVTLPVDGNGAITAPCGYPDHNLGPKRDCELTILPSNQLRSCTPGASVTLSCSLASSSSNPNPKAQVVRLCESSVALGEGLACRYNEDHLLANVVINPGASSSVTFTCPSARDSVEVGGKYSLYSGPVFNGSGGDKVANVVCL